MVELSKFQPTGQVVIGTPSKPVATISKSPSEGVVSKFIVCGIAAVVTAEFVLPSTVGND